MSSSRLIIADNAVSFPVHQNLGAAISCDGAVAARNVMHGHTTGMEACIDGGGNFHSP
jgi:hypothetical protein